MPGSPSVSDQLEAQILHFIIRLLQSSTCFDNVVLIIRRSNCINTASGIVTVCDCIKLYPANVENMVSS